MRPLIPGAGLWLAATCLTACGGPPTDASEDDFCVAFNDWGRAHDSFDHDFDEAKDASAELAEVGTPEEIWNDARAGFEILVGIDDDADDVEEAKEAHDDLSSDERGEIDAFFAYANETCY